MVKRNKYAVIHYHEVLIMTDDLEEAEEQVKYMANVFGEQDVFIYKVEGASSEEK